MRIVGGKWAGRHLTSPGDQRVRPTAEGVRDAWMRLLEPWLKGARVLDLFAGTGALGLEALSRGARYADFVETRPASLHALKANVAALRARERSRIFKKDALAFASAPNFCSKRFSSPGDIARSFRSTKCTVTRRSLKKRSAFCESLHFFVPKIWTSI